MLTSGVLILLTAGWLESHFSHFRVTGPIMILVDNDGTVLLG